MNNPKTFIMKALSLKIILSIVLLFPVALMSQSHSIDRLFEKYAGADGFTSVNISAEMFRLAATLGAASNNADMDEIKEIVAQLRGLKILVYDSSRESINKDELRREIQRVVQGRDFNELMSIQEKDSKVRFLTKNGNGNKISELVMVSESGKEIVLMSFTGIIDLENIGKVARSMNVKGMESLEMLNK